LKAFWRSLAKVSLQLSKKDREESFNHLLNELFASDKILQNPEILTLLQKFTLLPSIEIPFDKLYEFLVCQNKEQLNELIANGWLIESNGDYKLHQIIKEYIWANYTPAYSTLQKMVEYFTARIDNSADAQTANDVREDLGYFESVAISMKRLGIPDETVANLYERLGNIYGFLGEYSKALLWLEQSVLINEKVLSIKHPSTATSYNNIGMVYQAQGKHQEALEYFQKSLAIREEVLGIKHPDTATSYNNLGAVCYAQGKHKEALDFYKKSLTIYEEILGSEHPSTATSYDNLAELYKKINNYQKALEYYKKSLEIRKKVLNRTHPDARQTRIGLINLYELMNNKENAQEILNELRATQYEKYINAQCDIKITKKSEIKPVLGVQSIANTLASVIANQADDSGMMIGIFGKWGRGKTYLAEKTWESLQLERTNYKRVVFSAWKYQDTKASWAYLYETFTNVYFQKNDNEKTWLSKLKSEKKSYLFQKWNGLIVAIENSYSRTIKTFKINYTKHQSTPLVVFGFIILVSFGWVFIVNKLELLTFLIGTFGFIVLIKVVLFYMKHQKSAIDLYHKYFSHKNYNDYLGFQADIENELTNLLKTWIPIPNKNEKIVLFVDDIDRCHIEQIVNIIDGLRVILDNSEIHNRLIIITAIDEKILIKAIKHKYSQLGDNEIDLVFQEYLEKIFIIGLKLDSLNDTEVGEFLETFLPKIEPTEHEKIIEDIIDGTSDEKQNENNLGEPLIELKPSSPKPSETDSKEEKSSEPNPQKEPIETNSKDKSNEINSKEDDDTLSKPTPPQPPETKENITYFERVYMIKTLQNLQNNTPRKIRIFYTG